MDPSFGARLRAQREQQQVALSAISAETKIKLALLEGLERDDVSQWPEGIYRRAYVRAYARAVGLDPTALVREFLDVHPDPLVPPPAEETELENPQWPAGFRRLVTSAMAVVPSRRQRAEQATAEPVRPEPGPARPAEDRCVDDATIGESTQPREEPSLLAVAELCTRLGRAVDRREVAPILEDAAAALDAVGLIVWSWDFHAAALIPSLACGYSDAVLAWMPMVRADADNAIAAAYQSADVCVVGSGTGATGAVVVPLMSHGGCVGVLAIELRHGDEHRESVRAFATILAARLVTLIGTLVGSAPLAEAVNA